MSSRTLTNIATRNYAGASRLFSYSTISLAEPRHVPQISPVAALRRRASTLSSILDFWKDEFSRNGVSEPSTFAQLILAHVLGRKTLEGTSANQRMPSAVSTLMTTLAVQRLDGIPLQYVIGEWDFRYVW